MIFKVPTNFQELTLQIKVYTYKPSTIRIKVIDALQPNTTFTNRTRIIDGESSFYVRMPVSSKDVLVYVYNEDNGNLKGGQDNTFVVDSVTQELLEKKLDVIDMGNAYVKSFITFATKFCYNAGSLPTGNYQSGDKIFVIKYLPIIEDNGQEQTTPARIDIDSGVIEISKKQFLDYTIPSRMAILLHEFSHVYLNDNVDDEVEADLNALLIYLGLGYPRIEAFEVFASAFKNSPSQLNKMRYDKIKSFIDNFEDSNLYMFE